MKRFIETDPHELTGNVFRLIGRDWMLVTAGKEAHSFEPTPLDVVHLSKADVFVYNGGEGEQWVDQLLSAALPLSVPQPVSPSSSISASTSAAILFLIASPPGTHGTARKTRSAAD